MDFESASVPVDEEEITERSECDELLERSSTRDDGCILTNNNNGPAMTEDDSVTIAIPGFVTPENTSSPPHIPGTSGGAVSDPSVTPDTPVATTNEDEAKLSRVQALFNNILHHTSDAVFQHPSTNCTRLTTSTPSSPIHSPILATGIQDIPVHMSDRDDFRPDRFQFESYSFSPPALPVTTVNNFPFLATVPNTATFQNIQPRSRTQESFHFSVPQLMHPYSRRWVPSPRLGCPLSSHFNVTNNTTNPYAPATTGDLSSSASAAQSTSFSSEKTLTIGNDSESDLLRPVTCSSQHLDLKAMQPMVELTNIQTSHATSLVKDVLVQSVGRTFQSHPVDSDAVCFSSNGRQQTRIPLAPPVLTLDSLSGRNLGNTMWNDTDEVSFLGPSIQRQILLQPSITGAKDKESQRLRNTINQLLTEKCQLAKELKDVKDALSYQEKTIKGYECDINKLYTEKNGFQDKINRYKEKIVKTQVIQDMAFKLTLECGKLQASNYCLKLQNDRLAKDIDALFDFFTKKRRHLTKDIAAVDLINEVYKKVDAAADEETDDTDDDEDEDGEEDENDDDDDDDEEFEDENDDFGGGASGSGLGAIPPPDPNVGNNDDSNANGEEGTDQGQTGNNFSYHRISDNQLSQVITHDNTFQKRSITFKTRGTYQPQKTAKKRNRRKNPAQGKFKNCLKKFNSQCKDDRKHIGYPFKEVTHDFLASIENKKTNRDINLESNILSDEPLLKKMKHAEFVYPFLDVANVQTLRA